MRSDCLTSETNQVLLVSINMEKCNGVLEKPRSEAERERTKKTEKRTRSRCGHFFVDLGN